jgi:hypothetical protein
VVFKKFSGGYTPGPPPSGGEGKGGRGREGRGGEGRGREGGEGKGGEGRVGPPNFETVVAPLRVRIVCVNVEVIGIFNT